VTEAIVAGAIAGAVAGALAGLAVMMASHGLPRRHGPQWRSFVRHSARAAPFVDPAHVPHPHAGAPAPVYPPASRVGIGPFDRFADPAKRVLALAQDEAMRLDHNYIGTEHLLMGLLRDPKTIAGRVLDAFGVTLDKARAAVGMIVPRGDAPTTPSELTLSPRTKRVLELASEEARGLGHDEVTAAHLLLALVREGQGIACGIIESLGVSLERIRTETIAALGRRST
jgi:hypothetical protein